MKTCPKCNISKVLTDFNKDPKGAQGVKGSCKKCTNEIKKKWNLRNADKVRELHRAHDQKTSTKIKRQEYRNKNKEAISLRNKKWRTEHQDHIKRYDAKNKDSRNKKLRERYRCDVNYRLRRVLRNRLYDALRSSKNRTSSFNDLIGCTTVQLKTHLESLFRAGMTWINYGKDWHIDHILPCCLFDFSKASEQQLCFHWSNLQPLWAEENLKKGATFNVRDEVLTCVYLLFE